MIVYIENPIDSIKKLLNLISEVGCKSIFRNQRHFCTPTAKYQKQKSGKNPIYYSNKNNEILRNKLNKGDKRPVVRKLHNTEERN